MWEILFSAGEEGIVPWQWSLASQAEDKNKMDINLVSEAILSDADLMSKFNDGVFHDLLSSV